LESLTSIQSDARYTLAVKQLASIASNQRARPIHISTDYVFDGECNKPYLETDTPDPINIYGKTKLAGEK